MRRSLQLLSTLFLVSATLCAADSAFDISGPKIDVHVRRGEVTLPIGETANLLPGDRLWIHPDFPDSQSTHFVAIVAFLRGATNPPPPEWFTRVDTWERGVREEGVFVTVPAEAQQAVIFLAPETGGDFSTLRAAVRGRPGVFVRAVQDLQAASWDRMRLDAYLAEVKETVQTDPKLLKERAEKAARSLGIRLDQQCFDKPSDQQAPCLVQHTDGLVLDDANAQSQVEQLTNGTTGDLMSQISHSAVGGSGVYSPYIGAIVDTARILSSMHTAHFQYIPALALPIKDTLNLRLNVPPSFRSPKSVVVVALPPVGATKPPPLHAVNPAEISCAHKSGLVISAEGAPLVFATQLAHNMTLRIETKGGPIDLPVKADSSQGGLVLVPPVPVLPAGELTGTLHGKWGFDDWEGSHFRLRAALPAQWKVTVADQASLVAGHENTLRIEGENSLCVDRIEVQAAAGAAVKLIWKSPKPEQLEVTVPLKDTAPGPVNLSIYQFGLEKPDALALKAYAEPAVLERLTLSAGDTEAILKGSRLEEVAKATLGAVTWTPAALYHAQDHAPDSDQLTLKTSNPTADLTAGKRVVADVLLQDGRQLRVPVIVGLPRPQVTLLSKGAQDDISTTPSPVHLSSPDDLPVDSRLVFFLRTRVPENFPRDEKIEVAATDGSFRTVLTLADNSLVLEDAKTALGVVDPLARFGSSAFGPIHARPVSAEGVTGDWVALGTLVRLPRFKDLHCPRANSRPCLLTGKNLFLAASIAATLEFNNAAYVPVEFTGTQISVPHPVNGVLYLKLRDDPDMVQALTLPVLPLSAAQPVAEPAAAAPSAPATLPTPAPAPETAPTPSPAPSLAPAPAPASAQTPAPAPTQNQAQPPVPAPTQTPAPAPEEAHSTAPAKTEP